MNQEDPDRLISRASTLNELSRRIIGLCIEVHRELGPGLLESAYEECLAYEFGCHAIPYARQKLLPVRYKEVELNCGYRVDFVVRNELILELKALTELQPIHEAQILTYLKLADCPLGLLINFNVPTLKDGICRVVLGDVFRAKSCGAIGRAKPTQTHGEGPFH